MPRNPAFLYQRLLTQLIRVDNSWCLWLKVCHSQLNNGPQLVLNQYTLWLFTPLRTLINCSVVRNEQQDKGHQFIIFTEKSTHVGNILISSSIRHVFRHNPCCKMLSNIREVVMYWFCWIFTLFEIVESFFVVYLQDDVFSPHGQQGYHIDTLRKVSAVYHVQVFCY